MPELQTEAELLRAIWDDPWDDEVRLIYADHLDRAGDPHQSARADFIRVQCALARMPADDPNRAALERRARHLWGTYRKSFRRGLPERLRDHFFERGFVAPVVSQITGHTLVNVMLPLLPNAPSWDLGLRAIDVPQLDTLITSEQLVRVARLRVTSNSRIVLLARTPHARNLVTLDWQYTFAPASVVAMLGALPRLRELRIGSSKIGDDPALIAAADFAPRLRVLDIHSSELDAAGIERLFGTGRFSSLADLDLSYNKTGDAIVSALTTTALPALTRLRLFGMDLGPAGAATLANWPGARTLRHLDIEGNIRIGEAGVRALVESPQLENLETLSMYPTNRDSAAISQLLADRFGAVDNRTRWALRATRRARD